MIDTPAMRPMATLDEAPDQRRAVLEPWLCEGTLKNGAHAGGPCRKFLLEVDFGRPSFLRKVCGRCGHVNILVEAYTPSH